MNSVIPESARQAKAPAFERPADKTTPYPRLLMFKFEPLKLNPLDAKRLGEKVADQLTQEHGWPTPAVAAEAEGAYHLGYLAELPTAAFPITAQVEYGVGRGMVDQGVLLRVWAADVEWVDADEAAGDWRVFDGIPAVAVSADRVRELADSYPPRPTGMTRPPTEKEMEILYQLAAEGEKLLAEQEKAKRAAKAAPAARAAQKWDGELGAPKNVRKARAWAASTPGAISGQGGHNHTYYVANHLLRGFALTWDQAWEILVEWNQKCRPTWSDAELRHKLNDAMAKGENEWGFKLDAGERAGIPPEPAKDAADTALCGEAAAMAAKAPNAQPAARLVVRRLDSITPKDISWVWKGRIPAGMLSIIDGDPGLGKSMLTLDIAARVTNGWPMPLETEPWGDPADVVLLLAEDDPRYVTRPRADAAGVDGRRLHLIEATSVGGAERPVILPTDLDLLERTVIETRAKYVNIDPVTAFLDPKVDTNNDSSTRAVLARLVKLAERTGAAIQMVRHLNKDAKQGALYRGGGTMAFVGACRSALIVGRHPDDPNMNVLATTKINIAKKPRAIAYRIVDGRVPTIAWGAEGDWTADQIVVADGQSGRGRRQDALEAAKEFLIEFLLYGPKEANEVFEAAEADHHTAVTIRRAKKELEIAAGQRRVGDETKWFWWLPIAPEAVAA